jgi:hypothetical protein
MNDKSKTTLALRGFGSAGAARDFDSAGAARGFGAAGAAMISAQYVLP